MSVERSFEAWEEVQRHGLDLADKFAQGFSGLIHTHITPPSFPWPPLPSPPKPTLFDIDFAQNIFPREFNFSPINGSLNGYHTNPIFDIGNRIGQAGAEFGGFFNGLVQQVVGAVSFVPFFGGGGGGDKGMVNVVHAGGGGGPRNDMSILIREDLGSLAKELGDMRGGENEGDGNGGSSDDVSGFNLKIASLFGKSQGSVNITTAYDSRTRDLQNSIIARGDLWRLEASSGGSTSGTENSSLFLVQLGPLLFIRDTTFLLPIHLSKRHLLWYGYDKKNGLHSICPAVWSKHRRWLVMSMICLNPVACTFMDVQFPNGQLTYVAGEGLSTSAFLPVGGGLLQVQGQYPGEMRFSFSCKNKWGTRITPMVQLPDKSVALGFAQDLAWKRSGLLVRPTIQFNLCPTFGGSDPGVRAELIHSVKEQLSLIYGCSCSTYPSAYASLSLGRSKWNGNVGNTGITMRVETPLNNVGRPAFSVQLNSGIEF